MRDEAVKLALNDVIAKSYCLMPSTSDLSFLYPNEPEEKAVAKMLSAKAEIIALKRGEHGATLVSQSERFDIAGHTVEEIDPTGAGDCFCGTFIALLSQGTPLPEAGRIANAAGAIAVTKRGPMEGNSSPAEITAFLENANAGEQTK